MCGKQNQLMVVHQNPQYHSLSQNLILQNLNRIKAAIEVAYKEGGKYVESATEKPYASIFLLSNFF